MDVVVEVEAVDEAYGDGLGVDVAAGGDRSGVLLELGIDFEGDLIGKFEIETATVGEDIRNSVEVEECAGGVWVATILVVNLAAAKEEVGVGVIATVETGELDAKEDIFLGVDVASVDGISSADFGGGIEAVEGLEAEVDTSGDAEVLPSSKAGVVAGSRSEGGDLQRLGRGRKGLGSSEGASRKGEEQQHGGSKTVVQGLLLIGTLVR